MKKRKWRAVDALYWLGGGLVSVGVGLVTLPAAGLIAAGAFCLLGAYLSDGLPQPGKDGDGGA
ncbi:hypothetical protein [uncultured Oscillibacter sp.]|uniref:hypothetical protein n=1 Tax=uncultured Oscillibacter sp. TaxID=876091 RepID=UPI0025E93B8C|nr:hypothetical protein [uncultured Oscillibacter sp.]